MQLSYSVEQNKFEDQCRKARPTESYYLKPSQATVIPGRLTYLEIDVLVFSQGKVKYLELKPEPIFELREEIHI
jgi:hypothetical protein